MNVKEIGAGGHILNYVSSSEMTIPRYNTASVLTDSFA